MCDVRARTCEQFCDDVCGRGDRFVFLCCSLRGIQGGGTPGPSIGLIAVSSDVRRVANMVHASAGTGMGALLLCVHLLFVSLL